MARTSNPYDGAPAEGSESEPLFCANHPNVPTFLRCGRCEKPICARCRVPTPVGYRCTDCARLTVLPTYQVSTPYYTQAILAGLGVATLIGLLWAVLPAWDFWAALALGIGASEAVSAAANMKRGPGLQVVGLVAVAWGIILQRIVLAYFLTQPAVVGFLAGIPGNAEALLLARGTAGRFDVLALFLHNDLTGWLFLGMAFVLAYLRLR